MKIYSKDTDLPNYYNMRGSSMLPTCRPGEGVFIDSEIDRKKLEIGDIIVYSLHAGGNKKIIHRIVGITADGYKTRGDNNRGNDDYIVRFASIAGKASAIRRGDKTIDLPGGAQGRRIQRKLIVKKICSLYLLKIPSLISRLIEKSGILNLFHNFISIDIIEIKNKRGINEVLLHNNQPVGKKDKNTGKWLIRFPYKYFIDKNKLP